MNIVIFASGRGSNASNIIEHFAFVKDITVSLIVSNKSNAGVLDVARDKGIASLVIQKSELSESDFHQTILENTPSIIVLAGFLLKIPAEFIAAFPNKIINIHPSLLPKYGGKGMYGDRVHKAVLNNNEEETGITVHWVNENYDEGQIIEQKSCSIKELKTVDEIKSKVQNLEKETLPLIIQKLLENEF